MDETAFFYTKKIRSSDVDKNSYIKFNELVNYMQEAAWNNAIAMGYSTYELLKSNVSWVLNQQHYDIIRMPKHGETIKVETWPASMDRFFAYRNYRVFDEAGELIISSYSKWVIIDVVARKMIPIPENIAMKKTSSRSKETEPFSFKRIKFDTSNIQNQFPIKVAWSDLDVNGHINNAQYYKWMIDSLDESVNDKKAIKSLDIIFKSEGRIGEDLFSQSFHLNDNETYHRVHNPTTQKDLAVAKIEFIRRSKAD